MLVVDDDPVIRDLFSEYLGEKYECDTAENADEALAKLTTKNFALVISDVMMPGRNGIELLRDITSRFPDTAVMMVSGIDRPQRVRDALRLGAFDYLIKPVDFDVLTLSVDRSLDQRRLIHAAARYKADLEKQNIALAVRTAELERAQAQLVHNAKMASLGELAAGVAHELNNPAGFIYGNMDLLREYISGLDDLLQAYDGIELSATAEPFITTIKTRIDYHRLLPDLESIISDCFEGAGRIRDVVQNLRIFSHLDEAEIIQVNIHDGIDSTVRLLSRHYKDGRITLNRKYGDLPPISCFAGQLNQVWMNLLVNAAQSIVNRGEVSISTEVDGRFALITISDTGYGIRPDHIERVFDPFFTTKPVGEGTGLGLSITYGIVERHGGTITVNSTEGVGSAFTVRIPVSPDFASR